MTPSNGELRSSPVAKTTLALAYKLQQRKSIKYPKRRRRFGYCFL
uniref:Uncharacterized protein n=1 Tax=Siphoviridae sp. ct5tj9 TaxID=2823564 RepID=A0A8S5LGQ9_9CAUD|nr:MAG TPA: hypothetical protein [Siphoviridae sp. ct5tj9]